MLFELREMLKTHNIDFNIPDPRIRCLAHIINLSCQASLKVLKECNADGNPGLFEDNSDDSGGGILEDKSFPPQVNSKQGSNGGKLPNKLSVYGRLKRAANQIPKLKVLTDMPIRWNSTLKMLQRCLHLRKALDATMKSDDYLAGLTLSESEWSLVAEMVKFLEPFGEMTNRTSKQYLPLMSLTAAIYIQLYEHLESYKNDSGHHPSIIHAAKLACDKMNVYYPKTDGLVYLMGIVLDPRCKLYWHASVGFKTLVSVYKKAIYDIIERQMKRVKYDDRDELDKYLSEGPCKLSDHPDNVLIWWKEHESVYPQLSRMAKDFLGVAATGVPIECMFSMGTDLLSQKRLSMIAETIR
ncbi:unnamed protein product, partial [Allacma fusca]